MPPARKFQKEDIIAASYEIVRAEGLESLNARRVAKELSASVQPIFHNFESMEELKTEVIKRIYQTYKEYILSGISEENGYKQIGLSYIRFAREYPEFFKILYMKKSGCSLETFISEDETGDAIIRSGQELTGLSYEEQKAFHIKVWIFTHGIATLLATNTIDFTEQEINELLGRTVIEMLRGYQDLQR